MMTSDSTVLYDVGELFGVCVCVCQSFGCRSFGFAAPSGHALQCPKPCKPLQESIQEHP